MLWKRIWNHSVNYFKKILWRCFSYTTCIMMFVARLHYSQLIRLCYIHIWTHMKYFSLEIIYLKSNFVLCFVDQVSMLRDNMEKWSDWQSETPPVWQLAHRRPSTPEEIEAGPGSLTFAMMAVEDPKTGQKKVQMACIITQEMIINEKKKGSGKKLAQLPWKWNEAGC